MVIVLDGAYHSVIKSIAFEAVKIRCSKQCFSQKSWCVTVAFFKSKLD